MWNTNKKHCRITLRRVPFDQKEPRLEVIIEEQRTVIRLDALVTSVYLRQFSLCRSLFVFPAADAQVIGVLCSKLLIFLDFFSPRLGWHAGADERTDWFIFATGPDGCDYKMSQTLLKPDATRWWWMAPFFFFFFGKTFHFARRCTTALINVTLCHQWSGVDLILLIPHSLCQWQKK